MGRLTNGEDMGIDLNYVNRIKTDILRLNNKIGKIKYEISGGLAIPLFIQNNYEFLKNMVDFPVIGETFYREHRSFHINLHALELKKLENILLGEYELVTFDMDNNYKYISAEEALSKELYNLKFVKKIKNKSTNLIKRLDKFNVYPYKLFEDKKDEEVFPWFDGKFALDNRVFSKFEVKIYTPCEKPLKIYYDKYEPKEVILYGKSIKVANINWIKLLKENFNISADKKDIEIINVYNEYFGNNSS